MTAAAVLTLLNAAGVRLEVSGNNLLATPREALTDTHRAQIREHKTALVSLLSEADSARRLWLVALPTGERFSSSFNPPATPGEVRGWYPTALSVEPESDTAAPEGDATDPAGNAGRG